MPGAPLSRSPPTCCPTTPPSAPTGQLLIGGVDLADLAAEHGTPLFVYDEDHVRARCREAVDAFGAGNVVYATKAFLCLAMARLVHEEGLLLDVATGGELHVALWPPACRPTGSCSTATTSRWTSSGPRSWRPASG